MNRKRNGQFAPGNPGGPGRPTRQTEVDYLLATADAVSPQRWRKIVDRLAEAAENGDVAAAKFLAGHLLPPQPAAPKSRIMDDALLLKRSGPEADEGSCIALYPSQDHEAEA